MPMWEGGLLPDGDWILSPEAADIITRALGRETSAATVRRWCREGDWHLATVDIWHLGDRYYIDRASLLATFEAFATNMLRVVEEERAKLEGEGGRADT